MKLREPEGVTLPPFILSRGGRPGQGRPSPRPRPEPVPALGGTEPWEAPPTSREVQELPWEPPTTSRRESSLSFLIPPPREKRREPHFYHIGKTVAVEAINPDGETAFTKAAIY